MRLSALCCAALLVAALSVQPAHAAEAWAQFQGDALRSGNAPQAVIPQKLERVGSVGLTDGIYAAPVAAVVE